MTFVPKLLKKKKRDPLLFHDFFLFPFFIKHVNYPIDIVYKTRLKMKIEFT